jgi:uncharacterized protein (TIGR02001 family)
MNIKTLMVAMACLITFTATAHAEDRKPAFPYGKFSANVGFVSDYRFRGITQTSESPALQGGFDWSHDSGVYAGVWASNVKFTDASLETDVYGGYKFSFSGLNLDAGVTGYLYPGADSIYNYDYWEGKLLASYDFGFANLGFGLNYSPDNFAGSGEALYASSNITVPLMKTGVSFVGSLNHQWIKKNAVFGTPDYSDWAAGLTYNWSGFDFAAKYIDTSLSKGQCFNGADGCGATGVFSVSRTF